MTKDAAIQAFFESFGLNAYPATSVPTGSDAPNFPYITYNAPTDSDLERTTVSASVWYRTTNWTQLNSKVRQISESVGQGNVLKCDDGAIIIRKSTPFAQPLGDDSDNMIKRKVLTFEFLFVTIY
jgi:hypothetical protein